MNTAGAHELGYASAAIVAALLDRLISYIHAIVENKEKRTHCQDENIVLHYGVHACIPRQQEVTNYHLELQTGEIFRDPTVPVPDKGKERIISATLAIHRGEENKDFEYSRMEYVEEYSTEDGLEPSSELDPVV